MKSFLYLILTVALFGEIHNCSGVGETPSEAKEEAKKSAVAESSTYIKSVFQKSSSLNNKKEMRYILETIAKGVCKIESGKVQIFNNHWEFHGVCKVENEAISKTEEILQRVERLENRENSIFEKIANLENQIQNLPKDSEQVEGLKREIESLKIEVEKFPKVENLYYTISQNYKTTNLRISKLFTNLESEIESLESLQKEEISKFENRFATISQNISNLESRVSILERYQKYIFLTLSIFGVVILLLLFRRGVTIEKIADISTVSDKVEISTEKKIYYKNEKLKIDFANRLDREMYFYIIDINMRDETTLLYPAQNDNNLLLPNSKRELPEIDVVPPFGRDILKIIASPLKLEIPKIIYGKKSRVFKDSRGFSNPNIDKIEMEIAEESIVSDKDILAHFRGQALKSGFTLFENYIEVETRG